MCSDTSAVAPSDTIEQRRSCAPGDIQSGLLGKGICGLASPQSYKHQGDGHQQLSHQRQPVAPRAQHALQEQPVPLLPIQARALRE